MAQHSPGAKARGGEPYWSSGNEAERYGDVQQAQGGLAQRASARIAELVPPSWQQRCQRRCACCRRFVQNFSVFMANSSAFCGLTTVLTFYALFGDDMRLLLTDKPWDVIFDWITGTAMAIFALEIFVCAVGRKGYLLGFFFWLDCISTVTIVMDITVVAERMFGDSVSAAHTSSGAAGASATAGNDSSEAARAARMSRAGTKASRIVRLVRLVRLIRLVKWYRKKEGAELARPGTDWDEEDEEGMEAEPAVSKKLSEMTTRVVIMLVLVIMLALPFFQASFIGDDLLPTSSQYGLNVLYRRWRQGLKRYRPEVPANYETYMNSLEREVYENDFRSYIYYHNWFCRLSDVPDGKRGSPASVFGKLFFVGVEPPDGSNANLFLPSLREGQEDWNLRWSGETWDYYQCKVPDDVQRILTWNRTRLCLQGAVRGVSLATGRDAALDCPNGIRFQEREVLYPTAITQEDIDSAVVIMVVFDNREGSKFEAALNACQTLFICFLLGFGAVAFSSDANNLVLKPIVKIISQLEKVRTNPFSAMTIGDTKREEAELKRQAGFDDCEEPRRVRCFRCCRRSVAEDEEAPEPMETVVLEKTIVKIGSLLAIGFGAGGAKIIRGSVQDSEARPLNTMTPGIRAWAVFSICEIRSFLNVTDMLAEKTTAFVNVVATLVHSSATEFSGQPISNSSGSFLIAWRTSGQPATAKQKLADRSLVSMAKMVAEIAKSTKLARYTNHPKLVKRMPNFKCRVGVGLHFGWAVEGTVGSEYKVDAVYLGPTIAVTAALADATLEYGCLILVSDACRSMMSTAISKECRLVDRVMVPGADSNFKLYTFDLDDYAVEVTSESMKKLASLRYSISRSTKLTLLRSRREQAREKIERQRRKRERLAAGIDAAKMLAEDDDICAMRVVFTEELATRYHMGYLNYEVGDWCVAKDMLEKSLYLLGREDGPSLALIKFMKTHDYAAPLNWPGYRTLQRSR